MNVIFDLDGTLLASKQRLYALYIDLLPQLNLSFDQYWQYKYSGMTNIDIMVELAPCSEARKAE
ncbi:MAG: HAD hydrolase-like protein, partial [Gammaproteobacteria bacterium]